MPTTVAIRRRGWAVEYVDDVREASCAMGYHEDHELDGKCFPQERLILVDSEIQGRALLETEIHELIHAREPDWHENRVTPLAREIAAALWRLGWRAAPRTATSG